VLLVALLAASGPAFARGAGGDSPSGESDARLEWVGPLSDLHRQVAGTLRALRKSGARPSELLLQLLDPGLGVVAPLVDILVQERVPRARPDDAAQLLSVPQRELLLSALTKFPAERVRAEFERRLPAPPAEPEPRLRIAELRLLSAIGRRSDLPNLSAHAPREKGEIGPTAAAALREAFAAILRREPEAFTDGMQVLRSCDAGAAKQFLFALADLGDKRALPLLDQCARSIPELAQQAVVLLPRIGPSGEPEFDQALCAWLVERLDPRRLEWTRASLRAIGVLDDGIQVPALLEQLDVPQEGLREAALGALQQVSGLRLGPSKGAWREWYERECLWQSSGRQEALTALESGQDALVAQALGAFGEHTLYKQQRAEDVLGVLQHGSPAMRLLACNTLARIGSARALAPLVDLFADADGQLAEAAWRAACTLAGRTLPRLPQDARESLAKS
jgi:HEAT repeat protein